MPDQIRIEKLKAHGIIGLRNPERLTPQDILVTVIMDIDIRPVAITDSVLGGVNYSEVSKSILAHIKTAERYTVETLATDIAGLCLIYPQVTSVQVRISKPAADRLAEAVAVEITRTAEALMTPALIGLASNESAIANLKTAITRLQSLGRVVKTSTVYESPATEHAGYLNAVCRVDTPLPAAEIRRRLKTIEIEMGRTPESKQIGRMPIDLDLLMLGEQVICAGDVTIPEQDILSREYLARGCAELMPQGVYSGTKEPLEQIAKRLAGTAKLLEKRI
jgi:2-amino-4-hydroxy-6-hydroxymethyldihydropteridine diphosphokinase